MAIILVFRSNGGFGGTVVDYAIFLCNITFLMIPLAILGHNNLLILLLCLLCFAAFLCFSRVFFIVLFVILVYTIYLLLLRRSVTFAFAYIASLIAGLCYFMQDIFTNLLSFSSEISNLSDYGRITGWTHLLEDKSPLSLLFGEGFLINSGFKDIGSLVSGDGYIASLLSQTGVIGTFLLLICIAFVIRASRLPFSLSFIFLSMFFFMAFVNSGFFKIFNILTYFNSLWICSFAYKHGKSFSIPF